MIAVEVRMKHARWLPRLISSTTTVRPPVSRAGSTGTLDRGETFDIARLNGRRPSRAIAHAIRIAAVCTARQHTVIAIAEQIRKAAPSPSPRVLLSRYGMPDVLS